MPCQDYLNPAIGCAGPGTPSACAYCKSREKKSTPPPIPPRPKAPLSPQLASQLVSNTPVAVAQVSAWKPAAPICKNVPKGPPPPPPYELTRLEVTKACGSPGSYWQVVSATQTAEVTAVTNPNSPTAWSRLSWGTKVQQVSRASAGSKTISCRMDSGPSQSVGIDIYDLTSLSAANTAVSGLVAKVYEASGSDLIVAAATAPDEAKVWSLLAWSSVLTAGSGPAGVTAGDTPNQRKIALTPVRDVKITATLGCDPGLGQKKIETTIHICAWPNLEVQQVEFNSYSVMNDGETEIGNRFDKKWIKGRPDPAPKCVTASTQSPLCYPANSQITLSAIFNVIAKPTESETLQVSGAATVGTTRLVWSQQITVSPSDKTVQIVNAISNKPLPAGVAVHDALTINWYMSKPDTTLKGIGSTKHLLYVTLADRQTLDLYWTLLDISCTAAAGKTTENEFVAASFLPFTTHQGDNKGFPRKGDGLKLSYYKHGWKTQKSTSPYNDPWSTRGILGGHDASGRCGGWANLLLTMWKIHGVTSARQRWYVRSVNQRLTDMNQRFLVKNIAFPSAPTLTGSASLYTYAGVPSLKTNASPGAPGQGKTNPQFDFGDHVVVKHNGKLYDPSYGLGPYLDDASYLTAALAGLGSWNKGKTEFVLGDGTPQHIPRECVPYNKGFAEFRIGPETLDDVAREYSVSAQKLLDADPVLKALRGTPDKVKPGDVVRILTTPPTDRTIKADEITFDAIASAFGLTKQAIFDHPRNAALKLLRKMPANVVAGDRIVVSWELVPNGPWVIGHDQ